MILPNSHCHNISFHYVTICELINSVDNLLKQLSADLDNIDRLVYNIHGLMVGMPVELTKDFGTHERSLKVLKAQNDV